MSLLSTAATVAVLGVVGWLLYTFGKLTMADQGQSGGVPEQFESESEPHSSVEPEKAHESVRDSYIGEWK